jgi:hypothetical protein
MGGMKLKLLIASILAAYVGLAAAQDGPIQVWLFTFAPLVVVAIAFVLIVADAPRRRRAAGS